MSGPYSVIPCECSPDMHERISGPGLTEASAPSRCRTNNNERLERMAELLNAAFAAGQEAERKRVVEWLRAQKRMSAFDGLSPATANILADELEKGGACEGQ